MAQLTPVLQTAPVNAYGLAGGLATDGSTGPLHDSRKKPDGDAENP